MSGCADICLTHDYDGSNEFFSETEVKASRYAHHCCECFSRIPAGSAYKRSAGKSDGTFFSLATCLVCSEIRSAFVCGSFVFGALWPSMREEMYPEWRRSGAWDCLAKLTTEGAVAKCNADFAAWKDDDDNGEDLF